ncbi:MULTISPECIES: hypothetical protein [unclassified Variovorax]|uniref:hypothetical protein n=1 Tax=unclassified Variovorax TaxID=663243 RepID=UPI00076DF494|nr:MULTISPECIES: hypothetical protein [unclassified Variovorax]KWT97625.1 hypothetical protein APY03_1321 [Variovorax sp. WDL1]
MTADRRRPKEEAFHESRRFEYRHCSNPARIPLLNKVGFSIAPIDEQSSPEEKAACYQAVALAMDTLWKEFRGRHGDELAASGLFAQLPRFLAD